MDTSDYARVLMPAIPRQAFAPNPRKLMVCGIHLAIVVAGWVAFRFVAHFYWPLISLAIGSSLSCVALIAHDVSHRNVVRGKFVLYPTELVLWGLLCVPATVWKRVHTYHHVVTNSVDDPERRFLASEASLATTVYGRLFYPNRGLKYNPLCFLYFAIANIRNTVAAFYSNRFKPKLVPSKPNYTLSDKSKVILEIAVIVAIQFSIAKISGHGGYVAASLIPLFLVSVVTSAYFISSHALRPLRDDGDALASSTSLILPRFIDKLHVNQSYHSEHHLFPNMNPDYYPLVGALLQKHFPDAYHRIPVSAVWSQIWELPLFIAPPMRLESSAEASDRPTV
jgi:fatty acid desaturase